MLLTNMVASGSGVCSHCLDAEGRLQWRKQHVDCRQFLAGRETVAARVRRVLNLSSDRQADNIVNVVLESIVAEIGENIDTDGFHSEASQLWQIQSAPHARQDAQDPANWKGPNDRRQAQGEVHRSVQLSRTRNTGCLTISSPQL
jgi:hypothetical protein